MINNQSGFTLMEVLIAVIIMGISFTIIMDGMMGITDNLARVKSYNYINSWAKSKLNQFTTGKNLQPHGEFKYRNQYYQWHFKKSYPDSFLTKITLQIEWMGNDKPQTYSISTLILRNN